MAKTSTKVLLLVALLTLLGAVAFAARGNIDWCGPDQCKTSMNQEEAQTTLAAAINDEEEEVLALYEEEAETMTKPKAATRVFTTPTGKTFDCKSDCRVLFAASSCERCTYPFAFYNKNTFKNNICYDDIADLKKLTKDEKEQAKQMCVRDGLCSCQPWERLDAYMANTCTFQCGWFKGMFGIKKHVLYLQKKSASCPTQKNFAKGDGVKFYATLCKSGLYTKNWLMSNFGVTRTFNWNAALTNDVIDPTTKAPNKVNLKPIGAFTAAGISAKLYFDTENKLLAENGWKAILYLHKANYELSFEKTIKLDKVAGKTNRQYITDALNLANKDGFNSVNEDGKDFKSRVRVNKNSVTVSFTVKIKAKQTKEFKAACKEVSKQFSDSLGPKVNQLPQRVAAPAGMVGFINQNVPNMMKAKIPAVAEYLKNKSLRLVNYVGQNSYSDNNFMGQRVYLNVEYTKEGTKPSIEFDAYSQDALTEISTSLLQKLNPSWVISTSQD